MQQKSAEALSQWLTQKLKQENLSLRKAAAKTNLSHSTIQDILRGGVLPGIKTIHKLSQAFGGDGDHQKLALEKELLTLIGYLLPQPKSELSQPMAVLLDKISQFSEPQIKIINRFAEFLLEVDKES